VAAAPGPGASRAASSAATLGASPRSGVCHLIRPELDPTVPLHVTVRAVPGAPSLRRFAIAREIEKLLKSRARRDLPSRVVHFSLQRDHLHMIVEADDRIALARGIQGLLSAIARVVNRTAGRQGKLWRDRYHARPLPSPTEVRRALRYVLRDTDPAPVAPARGWLLRRGLV